MTRAESITKGKVWRVYYDANPDHTLFGGSKSKCLKWLRANPNGLWYAYRRGEIRIGQLVCEGP